MFLSPELGNAAAPAGIVYGTMGWQEQYTPLPNPYCPHQPTPNQAAALIEAGTTGEVNVEEVTEWPVQLVVRSSTARATPLAR